jgi:GT2 family glycosyltransferase
MRLSEISVIIATKDRPEELKKCVESLLGQEEVFPKEIIIVDSSGPGPVTSEKLDPEKRPCPVEIIVSRPGLTFQRNRGVKASKGSILAFLDDDCVVNKDYIVELEKAFNELPEAGGIHGLVLNPPKRNRLKRFFTDIFFLPEMSGTGKLKYSGVPSYLDFGVFESKKGPVMVEVLQGCGFSFRKVVFEKGYFFDESLEGYCLGEDYEFSFRVSGSLNYSL